MDVEVSNESHQRCQISVLRKYTLSKEPEQQNMAEAEYVFVRPLAT
jgi:hypothetical protein